MKILIAEDDETARELIAEILQQDGYEVVQACDGANAWQEFGQSDFGVVISDWLMPETDGLELCRRIRSAKLSTYPYIILLTALKGKDYYLEGMEAGADDFISKPFDPDEFRAKLHAAQRIVSLQRRVSTLEGILPTCMYCRKIRDEQNAWVTLEQYVTERSNAAFSHGVCPECYEQASAQFK
jgi:DNA-binding response OmpR family regulator